LLSFIASDIISLRFFGFNPLYFYKRENQRSFINNFLFIYMKKVIYTLISLMATSLPSLAFAQTSPSGVNSNYVNSLANLASSVLNWAVYLIMVLALVYFLWGVAQYIIKGGNPEEKAKAKSIMVYGIIGLAVMASVWGLVGVLTGIFNVSPQNGANSSIPVPQISAPVNPPQLRAS
jgi:membrane-anchored glycerophosphoryl diester phosphodiesterase (GDPDase)